MNTLLHRLVLGFLLTAAFVSPVSAADWPMWRHDATRSGVSSAALPVELQLQWSRDYPPETPAWPDQEKMPFDICFEPIVVGKTLYMNSARHDCVRAVDVDTGDRKWVFFADGPVRFAPLHHNGKIYFTCDDGCLYCVTAETGELVWKLRGGPSDRRILGNQRIISTWPARGAPVVADDTLYFAASIWPFMGVFIHAVDPETGKILWTNDGDGSTYMKQPHATDAFASVAPQGPLAIDGNHLLIPGGRSIPAVFERKNGKLLRLPLAENGKLGGGSEVVAFGDIYFNGGSVFETKSSKFQGNFAKLVLTTPKILFAYDNNALKAFNPATYRVIPEKAEPTPQPSRPLEPGEKLEVLPLPERVVEDPKNKPLPPPVLTKTSRWRVDELATIGVPSLEVMIMAGNRIYAGGDNVILAIDYDPTIKTFAVAWRTRIEGKVCRLVAGANRLFAVTREGQLFCFGQDDVTPRHYPLRAPVHPPELPALAKRVKALVDAGGARDGYAVQWGYGDGIVATEILRQTNLQLLSLEPSAENTLAGRRAHAVADTYGTRIAILPGEPKLAQLPPFFASVIFANNLKAAGISYNENFLRQAFHSLRPFGGRLVLSMNEVPSVAAVEQWARNTPQAKVRRIGDFVVVSREGPIPGSANWTHEHADSSNTRVSKDSVVKAPMGILWFGGPSHEGVLPRHGHGPQPQVIDGRVLIEGVDMLRCLDVYTGRMLWETSLPGLGTFYNNVQHQAGANSAGSNFVSMHDGIYVAWDYQCVVLDPDTGKIKRSIKLPPAKGTKAAPRWGYINIEGDHLIAGADPLFDEKNMPPKNQGSGDDDDKSGLAPSNPIGSSLKKIVAALKPFSDNMSASRRIIVLDRHSGAVIWETTANYSFRHNGTCVGNGRIFTIDRLSGDELLKRKKSTDDLPKPFRVVSFDLFTGDQMWEVDDDVFGTWLSYSAKHDILLEAGRLARDTLKDEPRGVRACDARTGKELWFDKSYGGPAMIHGDEILLEKGACDIRTGGLKLRDDPITGVPVPWSWTRTYGCNTPLASEHLLTFRSGAAGYFDLCNDGGTGNFGGFRSSCTNNLIVAGGLLVVPEYTRTCTCNYQNQTSVAMIHQPDAEMWTFFGTKETKGTVKRLGINLGAVGDRRAENGTLWLEYPSTGGVSPAVNVNFKPGKLDTYRRFSGNFTGPLPWVASSGVNGIQEIAISVGKEEERKTRPFTVRLVFAEPEPIEVGQRRFDVHIQDVRKLADFDITKEAGGARKSIIREFHDVLAGETLTVLFTAPGKGIDYRGLPPIVSGIEVIEEEDSTSSASR